MDRRRTNSTASRARRRRRRRRARRTDPNGGPTRGDFQCSFSVCLSVCLPSSTAIVANATRGEMRRQCVGERIVRCAWCIPTRPLRCRRPSGTKFGGRDPLVDRRRRPAGDELSSDDGRILPRDGIEGADPRALPSASPTRKRQRRAARTVSGRDPHPGDRCPHPRRPRRLVALVALVILVALVALVALVVLVALVALVSGGGFRAAVVSHRGAPSGSGLRMRLFGVRKFRRRRTAGRVATGSGGGTGAAPSRGRARSRRRGRRTRRANGRGRGGRRPEASHRPRRGEACGRWDIRANLKGRGGSGVRREDDGGTRGGRGVAGRARRDNELLAARVGAWDVMRARGRGTS